MVRAYFTERLQFLVLEGIQVGIFLLVFWLFDISLFYIWYPAFLCMLFLGCYIIWDFIQFRRKHIVLQRALQHIDITLEKLPVAEGQIEKDYQILLQELLYRKNKAHTEWRESTDTTMECLTLWTHQLKTPLTALQLLAQEMEEPVRREALTRLFEIEQYGEMMLQFLRLEGEGTDYVLKRYSVLSMVNQAVKYFARIFISKGIGVQIAIDKDAAVVTDEKWMVFALKQLISNGLKYTKEGSITITMEGNRLILEDTGIGIQPEDLPRIFERGFTGYNGRKDKKATGLGLYLTRQICGRLNHQIEITSRVGEGTRVELIFQNQ